MWSPESALKPHELTAMPLWIDLKGVPNDLFSHKGLKCLTKVDGKFVKLHPNTEKCIWLDVARVLAEVDLLKPLIEKIVFKVGLGIRVFGSGTDRVLSGLDSLGPSNLDPYRYL